MSKEVEQWITVNGVHIPIFKGGSKEEAVKNFLNKQTATGKEKSNRVLSSVHDYQRAIREAKTKEEVQKLVKDAGNLSMSQESRDKIISTAYDKAQELRKQTDEQKNITKNDDEKDQQIARNQKEADARKAEENRPIQEVHKAKIKELESDKYEGDNTYDLDTLKPVSFEDGYQVTFCQIGDNYTNDQYQAKVNECLKLSSNGKTYAGKFEGTPEISFHCANREQAIAYAKANNQISIWDWKAGNADWRYGEIKTGGTGRRK